jgi:hypothetical protein
MKPRASRNNHCANCLNALDDHDGWLVTKYPGDFVFPEDMKCPPKRDKLPNPWPPTT